MLPLDLGIRAVVVFVLQLARDGPGAPGLDVRNGGVDAIVGRVRLGRGGDQHDRICQRQAGLRQANGVGDIHRRFDNGDNLRPGQADILTRADHQAAAGAGQVARFQQAAQIMQRCVGVRAAHGFLVGRDDIVVVVAQFIIPHGGTHGHLLYHVQHPLTGLLLGHAVGQQALFRLITNRINRVQ